MKLITKKKKKGFLLSDFPQAPLPSRIYGREQELANSFLTNWETLGGNMGVLLSGLKGSGKSLFADILCYTSGHDTYLVLESMRGLQEYLASFTDPCVVLFQEFDKSYRTHEEQDSLLSILDGSFGTNILFILTTNTADVNPLLINRPGRVRYHREFGGLSADVINEVIQSELRDSSHLSELSVLVDLLGTVSMDVLRGIISEVNITGKSPKTCLEFLNVKLEHTFFDVRLVLDKTLHHTTVDYNPLITNMVTVPYEKEGRWGKYTEYYMESLADMEMSIYGKELHFRDKGGNRVVFTPTSIREKFKIWK